jgi:hypothetical protein
VDEGLVKLVNGPQLGLGDAIRPAEIKRHHFLRRGLLLMRPSRIVE